MYTDAVSTRFSVPLGVIGGPERPENDFLNVDDVRAAAGFRKRPHDKSWVPRRLREQWITVIHGLLPERYRSRMFAPPSPPLFTPPPLTSRERDTLNISPIGFPPSRPSSPGGLVVGGGTLNARSTLSDYFATLTSAQGGKPGSGGHASGGGSRAGSPPSSLQRPRFDPHSSSSGTLNLMLTGGGGGGGVGAGARPNTVSGLIRLKRPRSRADGRLSKAGSPGGGGTLSQTIAIVRSTTPLHPTLKSSASAPSLDDFEETRSRRSPHATTSSFRSLSGVAGTVAEEDFGFEAVPLNMQQSMSMASLGEGSSNGNISRGGTTFGGFSPVRAPQASSSHLFSATSPSLDNNNNKNSSMGGLSASSLSPVRGLSSSATFPGSPVFGFQGLESYGKLSKMLSTSSINAANNGLAIKAYNAAQSAAAQRPATAQYDTVTGRATVFAHFQKQVGETAREVLQDNKGWANKVDAAEKRLVAQDKAGREYLVKKGLKPPNFFFRPSEIQNRKVEKCVDQDTPVSFFGKSAQGTFNVDEEKPYVHQFRDYKTLPIFYN